MEPMVGFVRAKIPRQEGWGITLCGSVTRHVFNRCCCVSCEEKAHYENPLHKTLFFLVCSLCHCLVLVLLSYRFYSYICTCFLLFYNANYFAKYSNSHQHVNVKYTLSPIKWWYRLCLSSNMYQIHHENIPV